MFTAETFKQSLKASPLLVLIPLMMLHRKRPGIIPASVIQTILTLVLYEKLNIRATSSFYSKNYLYYPTIVSQAVYVTIAPLLYQRILADRRTGGQGMRQAVGIFNARVTEDDLGIIRQNPRHLSEYLQKFIVLFRLNIQLQTTVFGFYFKQICREYISIDTKNNDDLIISLGFNIDDADPRFICPISRTIMDNPVRIKGGHSSYVFERKAIAEWLKSNRTNPLDRSPLCLEDLEDDLVLKEK